MVAASHGGGPAPSKRQDASEAVSAPAPSYFPFSSIDPTPPPCYPRWTPTLLSLAATQQVATLGISVLGAPTPSRGGRQGVASAIFPAPVNWGEVARPPHGEVMLVWLITGSRWRGGASSRRRRRGGGVGVRRSCSTSRRATLHGV
jgi:hypothetical protein